jgi:hypothetical protein
MVEGASVALRCGPAPAGTLAISQQKGCWQTDDNSPAEPSIPLCKGIIDRGRSPCGEQELVAALTKQAADQRPDLRPDQAFSKLFESEESVRRACNIAKGVYDHADLTPTMVGTPDAMHSAVSDTEQSEAYAQLEEMAARMRATSPWLSAEQAFARVFEDAKNAALAAKAHRRPQPTSIFQHPSR